MVTLTMDSDDAQELAKLLTERLDTMRDDYGDSGAYAWIERLVGQLESPTASDDWAERAEHATFHGGGEKLR